ncbi:MAG: erythromycin esterase family protein, partial [Acidobacteria bacterium]|nr:erythromycin esterase family protein [Acidobacteriota bacterium]
LYSLYTSIEAVLAYLDKIDPPAAKRARFRYLCLEHFGKDVQRYGYAAEFGLARSCEDEVVQQLEELRQKAADYAQRNGRVAADEFFYAEQNARLVQNAEEYYRLMFRGSVSSWNLRDQHLSETLDALFTHLNRGNDQAKIVLWAHNSHLGDARATEMGQAGELNLGQLTRTRYGSDAVLVGFTTYTGTVTAADEWNGAGKRKLVRPALKDSYEAMFHKIPQSAFMLVFGDGSSTAELAGPMLERAIGVIYLPQTERLSHYFRARLPNQFDAIIHIDTTTAVEPLEPTPEWHTEEWETYPSGV